MLSSFLGPGHTCSLLPQPGAADTPIEPETKEQPKSSTAVAGASTVALFEIGGDEEHAYNEEHHDDTGAPQQQDEPAALPVSKSHNNEVLH